MLKTIARAAITARLGLHITLDPESGDYMVLNTIGTAEVWDGRSYLTEAAAREAGNREWRRIRAAERAA